MRTEYRLQYWCVSTWTWLDAHVYDTNEEAEENAKRLLIHSGASIGDKYHPETRVRMETM